MKSQVHVHNRRLKELSDVAHLTELGKAFQQLRNYNNLVTS